jgi:hypothetical protein
MATSASVPAEVLPPPSRKGCTESIARGDEVAQLVEHAVELGGPCHAAREVELEAEQHDALVPQRAGEIEAEEVGRVEHVTGVVVREERGALAALEGGPEELEAGDALARPRIAAHQVRSLAHQPAQLGVERREAGRLGESQRDGRAHGEGLGPPQHWRTKIGGYGVALCDGVKLPDSAARTYPNTAGIRTL